MIEIIKHGKFRKHEAVCPLCKCEFNFDNRDILDNSYVKCPECGCNIKEKHWILTDEYNSTKDILDEELTNFDLSVRALNCLKASDINYVKDLISLSKKDLLRFRNFGRVCLWEIENFLYEHNLKLKE